MPADNAVDRPAGPSPLRIVLRVVGAVLLIAGVVLIVRAGLAVAHSDTEDPGFGAIFGFAGGGFACVFGLAFLNAGFLGAQANYVAGEVSPAVGRVGSAFRSARATEGRSCASCGARNDLDARFCDGCGTALA